MSEHNPQGFEDAEAEERRRMSATPPTLGTTGNAPERLDSPDAGAGRGNDPVTALPTPDLDAVREHANVMAGHYAALARETENPAMRAVYERNGDTIRALLAALAAQREPRP